MTENSPTAEIIKIKNSNKVTMSPSILKLALTRSLRGQLGCILLGVAILPLSYLALEIPKELVNFLKNITSEVVPETLKLMPALTLRGVSAATAVSLLAVGFLAAIAGREALEYWLNRIATRVDASIDQVLSNQIARRLLLMPDSVLTISDTDDLVTFLSARKQQTSEFATKILSVPLIEGGRMLVLFFFAFTQGWVTGLVLISLYPLQVLLQRTGYRRTKVLRAQAKQCQSVYQERLRQIVDCVREIHSNDAAYYELRCLADSAMRASTNAKKLADHKRRIKMLNDLLDNVLPFLFYLVGGLMVLQGKLTLGALVAVIGAHRQVLTPWNKLIGHFREAVSARDGYVDLLRTLRDSDILQESVIDDDTEEEEKLAAKSLIVHEIKWHSTSSTLARSGWSFSLSFGKSTAILAPSTLENELLARLVARMSKPPMGWVALEEQPWWTVSDATIGRQIGYAGSDARLVLGSLLDNLTYGIRRRCGLPKGANANSDLSEAVRCIPEETLRWLDLTRAGIKEYDELFDRLHELATLLGFDSTLLRVGMEQKVDPVNWPELTDRLLDARARFREVLNNENLQDSVELFDPWLFHESSSLLENIIFGRAVSGEVDENQISADLYRLLYEADLDRPLVHFGFQVARLDLELREHHYPKVAGVLPIPPEEVSVFRTILADAARLPLHRLDTSSKERLLRLALRHVNARDLGVGLPDLLKELILEGRTMFHDGISHGRGRLFMPFEPDAYNPALSIEENLVFGTIRPGHSEQIRLAILRNLIDWGIAAAIIPVALLTDCGRISLTPGEQRRLMLVRALLKQPAILVLNGASGAFVSGEDESILDAVARKYPTMSFVWSGREVPKKHQPLFSNVIALRGN